MANTKILALMLMLLMIVSIIPAVMADDTNETDTEDEDESENAECTIDTDCEEGQYCDSENECEEIDEDESEDETEDESEDETEDESEDETEDEDESEDETEDETEDESEDETEDEPEDEEDLDEDTEDELAAVISPHGAEVRLLQLEKSLNRNILHGKEVVKSIKEYNSSIDVTELNAIISDMEDLLAEVEAEDPTEATGEELAQRFVDLKSEAIELTSLFREAVKDLLPEGYRNEIRGDLNKFKHQEIENLEKRIKEAKQKYNAEQITDLFEALGIDDEELLQAVEDGTATKEDIKDAVKDALSEMTHDEIADAMLSLRESKSKKAVAHRAAVAEAVSGLFERQSQRWEERSERFLNKSAEAGLNNRSSEEEVMKKLSDMASEKSADILEHAEQIRYRIQSRNSDEGSENSGEESDDFDDLSESNSPGSAGNGNRGN